MMRALARESEIMPPAEAAAASPMTDQPLLIALVAVQFIVHALGWAMTARLTRRWPAAEGHFAMFWLFLAAGLLLYVPPWPSGSAPRNLADVLIVAAVAIQHRGMAMYWSQRPSTRAYTGLLVLTVAAVGFSMALKNGHGLRVATVCIGAGMMLAATVRLIWQHARAASATFARVVCSGYSILALALFARAVQALSVEPATKISIDAPGHANIPFAILVMFVGGLINLAQIRLVLGRVLEQLTSQARTDALTGTLNRRGLMLQLQALHVRAREGSHEYVLMMVDIDHFKAINDQHGHAVGDHVLKWVAQNLRDGLRAGDVVARWGGEEFCILLPRTQLAEARTLAERLTFRIAAAGTPRVTVSIGVAEAHAQAEEIEQTLRRADEALYRAKVSGRNRVVIAGVGAHA
jgi:diguanylate cyclase (GGDEF)-like protein